MHQTQEAQFMKEISIRVYNLSQDRGLNNYQSGGNPKKGEVNFERDGGSDPLEHCAL